MYLSKVLKVVKQIAQDVNIIKQDVIYLTIKAGNGGNGLAKFNGVGGRGGSIYLYPTKKMSFAELIKTYKDLKSVKAQAGQNAKKTALIGKEGPDQIIEVPLGCDCVIENNFILLARCKEPNKKYLVASGGKGGCAENNYIGEKGENIHVGLHLKLRPNIGLIGFPNAGKSTLLKAFAPNKNVKIANYPFTTLRPQIGYVKYEDKELINKDEFSNDDTPNPHPFSLSIADLPGLIEGSSRNRGCGHSFLKHMENSEILLIVIDVFGFQLMPDSRLPSRTAIETLALLNKELEDYSLELLQKPTVVALNKVDLPSGKEKAEEIINQLNVPEWTSQLPSEIQPKTPFKMASVIPISAKKNDLGDLKTILKNIHDELNQTKSIHISELDSRDKKILF